MKNITLQWWNFLIIFLIIFILGVIVGFMVIPHPGNVTEDTPADQIVSGKVEISEKIEPRQSGEEIKAPKPIKRVEPVYPEIARQAAVEGTVICEATTDIYGRVDKVKVIKSIPLLDQAAVDAIKQWIYEPEIIDGEPRGVVFTVTVSFNLN